MYLAQDRSDIQVAVKEFCRAMSNPTVGDEKNMKVLARYLVGNPRVKKVFGYQEALHIEEGLADQYGLFRTGTMIQMRLHSAGDVQEIY